MNYETSVTASYGAIGKPPIMQKKDFATSDEANKHFAKTEAEKRKKCYDDAVDPSAAVVVALPLAPAFVQHAKHVLAAVAPVAVIAFPRHQCVEGCAMPLFLDTLMFERRDRPIGWVVWAILMGWSIRLVFRSPQP